MLRLVDQRARTLHTSDVGEPVERRRRVEKPTVRGEVSTNSRIYTSLPNVYAGPITDFRLDTLAISSYSAAGDAYGDSLLAHGAVDNIIVTLPPPPVQGLTGAVSHGLCQVQFNERTNWLYTLQRTADFQTWTEVSPATPGVSGALSLSDTNALTDKAFYRVRASRP